MVSEKHSEGKKRKPRGRPFTSEYNPRKPKSNAVDVERHESSDERGTVNQIEEETSLEAQGSIIDAKAGVESEKEKESIVEPKIKTAIAQPPSIPMNVSEDLIDETKVDKAETVIEEIEFKRGNDCLKIVFKKKHNRMFRIQIFLNGETEIRPVTHHGSSTAYSFWNLLKNSLQKD